MRRECNALVKTSLHYTSLDTIDFSMVQEHSNHINHEYVRIKYEKMKEMKGEIIRSNITTDEVIYTALDNVSIGAARYVGDIETIKRNLRRVRQNFLNPHHTLMKYWR